MANFKQKITLTKSIGNNDDMHHPGCYIWALELAQKGGRLYLESAFGARVFSLVFLYKKTGVSHLIVRKMVVRGGGIYRIR